jgi:hypothetical protein
MWQQQRKPVYLSNRIRIAVAEAPLSPVQRMPYLGIQLDQSERADCGQLDSLVGPPVRPEREVDWMTPVLLHERHGPGRDGLRLLGTVTSVQYESTVRERERETYVYVYEWTTDVSRAPPILS